MGFAWNEVTIGGGLTRDPELKYTPSGTAVLQISLAITEKRKGASGQYEDKTTYPEVTLWGRTAEVVAEYCKKGSQLLVKGRLDLDQWTDKNTGDKRSKLKVTGDRIQLIGSAKGGGGQGVNQGGRQQNNHPSSDEYSQSGPDDDAGIPF